MRTTKEAFSFNLSVVVHINAGETVGQIALSGEEIQAAVTKNLSVSTRAHILPGTLEFEHWLSSASSHKEKGGTSDTAYTVKISGRHLQPGCIYILPGNTLPKSSTLHTEVPWEFLYNPDTHVLPPPTAHNIMQTKFTLPGYMHKFAQWHARKEPYRNHTMIAEKTFTTAQNKKRVIIPACTEEGAPFGVYKFIDVNYDAFTKNARQEWGFAVGDGDIIKKAKSYSTTPEVLFGCRNILSDIIRPTLIPDLKLSVEIPSGRGARHNGVTLRLVFCLRGELIRYFVQGTEEEVKAGGALEQEVDDLSEFHEEEVQSDG